MAISINVHDAERLALAPTGSAAMMQSIRTLIDRILNKVVNAQADKRDLLLIMETELARMDRTINIVEVLRVTPTKFQRRFKYRKEEILPEQHVLWAYILHYPVNDVEVCAQTGLHLYDGRHRAMWTKFQNDFPIEHPPYRQIVKDGVSRTLAERKGDRLSVLYYTPVPLSAISLKFTDTDEV